MRSSAAVCCRQRGTQLKDVVDDAHVTFWVDHRQSGGLGPNPDEGCLECNYYGEDAQGHAQL